MERERIIVELTYDIGTDLREIKEQLEKIRKPPIRHYHILKLPHRVIEFD